MQLEMFLEPTYSGRSEELCNMYLIHHNKKNRTGSVVFFSLELQPKRKYRCKGWTFADRTIGNILIFVDFCGFGEKKRERG